METRKTHGETGLRIASSLRNDILDGVYRPGERIRQDELAQRHGASRLPVREALRKLEAEGLVTLVANTGAWVSELSAPECQELYLMRESLEPLLLRMNVPVIPAAQLHELAELADAMGQCDDVEKFLVMDRQFHLSPLRHAPTTILMDTVLSLWNRTQHYRRAATRLYYSLGDRSVHHDHHLIVGALRRKDEVEAERLLSIHIRRSRHELGSHPEVFTEV